MAVSYSARQRSQIAIADSDSFMASWLRPVQAACFRPMLVAEHHWWQYFPVSVCMRLSGLDVAPSKVDLYPPPP